MTPDTLSNWLCGGVVALVFLAMLYDALKTKSEGDAWHDHRPKR